MPYKGACAIIKKTSTKSKTIGAHPAMNDDF